MADRDAGNIANSGATLEAVEKATAARIWAGEVHLLSTPRSTLDKPSTTRKDNLEHSIWLQE